MIDMITKQEVVALIKHRWFYDITVIIGGIADEAIEYDDLLDRVKAIKLIEPNNRYISYALLNDSIYVTKDIVKRVVRGLAINTDRSLNDYLKEFRIGKKKPKPKLHLTVDDDKMKEQVALAISRAKVVTPKRGSIRVKNKVKDSVVVEEALELKAR